MSAVPVQSPPHRFVVVEGPIGAGKTSLARRLAESLSAELVLEQAEENPFLERFYRNPRAGAFPTQLHFLFQRARQLQQLRQQDLFEPVRVADYLLEKDRLFARVTLDDEEYALYEQVYGRLALDAPVPDLVVYLQAPVEVLLERIAKRGIKYEQYIDRAYLERLLEAYTRFFHHYDSSPLLIVNATDIDPVSSDADFEQLFAEIRMETVTRIQTLRERVRSWRLHGLKVGFVPTMGNLHTGHSSLVAQALERADRVVASIYVNPLQFGPDEDPDRYPRTLRHDTELLSKVGAHLLFAPTTYEIYPGGFERTTVVDVPELSGILCGAFRPGHFIGVATILTKLFQIVQPDVTVFGEKDYQQLMIVRRLVLDLSMPIEVVGATTIREPDGLALGSSNRLLTPEERAIAPRLQETLKFARQKILDGDRDWAGIQAAGTHALDQAGFVPQYFTVRQAGDLRPAHDDSRDFVLLAAAMLGKVRLIDNVRAQLVQKL